MVENESVFSNCNSLVKKKQRHCGVFTRIYERKADTREPNTTQKNNLMKFLVKTRPLNTPGAV